MAPRSHNDLETEPSAFNCCRPVATIREDKEKWALWGRSGDRERDGAGFCRKYPKLTLFRKKTIPSMYMLFFFFNFQRASHTFLELSELIALYSGFGFLLFSFPLEIISQKLTWVHLSCQEDNGFKGREKAQKRRLSDKTKPLREIFTFPEWSVIKNACLGRRTKDRVTASITRQPLHPTALWVPWPDPNPFTGQKQHPSQFTTTSVAKP